MIQISVTLLQDRTFVFPPLFGSQVVRVTDRNSCDGPDSKRKKRREKHGGEEHILVFVMALFSLSLFCLSHILLSSLSLSLLNTVGKLTYLGRKIDLKKETCTIAPPCIHF